MSKARVLVIDDEESICDACMQALSSDGYDVDANIESTTAIEKISEYRPDIVLVDLKMPGVSGFEILDRISGMDKAIVAIVITGYATVENAVESMRRGAFDFLKKPFTSEALRKAVEKAVKRMSMMAKSEIPESADVGSKTTTESYMVDVVYFGKTLDLPQNLYPFARSATNIAQGCSEDKERVVVFKVRGTVDCHHALVVGDETDLAAIEEKLDEELGDVKLAKGSVKKLQSLLLRSKRGEFVHYTIHHVDAEQYPHRQ